MLKADKLASLIARVLVNVYDAVGDPENTSLGLQSVCEAVGGRHLVFFAKGVHPQRPQFVVGVGIDKAHIQRVAAAIELGLMPIDLLVLPSGATRLASGLWIKDPETGGRRKRVPRADEGCHSLLAAPLREPDRDFFLVIERLCGDPPFTGGDVEILQAIVPHLSNAIRLRKRLEQAEQARQNGFHALDRIPFGVVLVDAEMHPVLINSVAENLLKQNDGIAIRHGKLAATTASVSASLRRSVARAIALQDRRKPRREADAADAVMTINIAKPSDRTAVIATVLPIDVSDAERLFAAEACALILLARPQEQKDLDTQTVERALGLTPRQAALAVLLASGITLSKAGTVLGVTRETARWHLREIFERTNTNRQQDLAMLVIEACRVGSRSSK